MPEIHARWLGRGGVSFCGARGGAVTIRHPDDWDDVTCPTCRYAATRNE